MPPAHIENNVLLIPNQVATIHNSNGYTDIYSSDSEDDPVFKEMVRNYKTANSIDTSSVLPQRLTLASTPTKVLKKQHNTRGRTQLAYIKQAQSDTTASAIFLLNALHSVSQAITCAGTDKIAIYNNTDIALYADLGASEEMFPY